MDDLPPFLTVKQAATMLQVATTTLTAAIDQGRIHALRLGEGHRSTRLLRTALFPEESAARDQTTKRLRRLVLELRGLQDDYDRKLADALTAKDRVNEALRKIEQELRLHDLTERDRETR